MDLLATMRSNGSVRGFTDDPVADDTIYRVLDAARFAPSGGNKQGWRVIVVKDPGVRAEIKRLSKTGWNEYAAMSAAGQRAFGADESGRWPGPGSVDLAAARAGSFPFGVIDRLDTVPVMLIVCVDLRVVAAVDTEVDRVGVAAGGSIYPFTQNILLAARTEGLGGVMTTFVVREEPAAQALLGLPKYMAIASLIVLGVPQHQNTKLKRHPVEAFTTIDHLDGPALQG